MPEEVAPFIIIVARGKRAGLNVVVEINHNLGFYEGNLCSECRMHY
jgi:hypothetical protein